MQRSLRILLSLAVCLSVVQGQYILAEFYDTGVCTGDVVYQLFSSFNCVSDLDGDINSYFSWSYNGATITYYDCTDSLCNNCVTSQYAEGVCYAGWTYTYIDNVVDDKVGLFYYSDQNCVNITAVETYRDNECIADGGNSYQYMCDTTGQATYTYCSNNAQCTANCVTFPYPAICSYDTTSGYYTEVKCDAGNLTVNLMLVAVVVLSMLFM